MNLSRFLAIFHTRNLEFLRDRSALAWNILFPVLIVFGFAFAFSGGSIESYKVGVYPSLNNTDIKSIPFFAMEQIKFIAVNDLANAKTKIERHQLDMLFDHTQRRYWLNPESPSGIILEKVYLGSLVNQQTKSELGNYYTKQLQTGKEIRYIDWLLPGVLAMNMMFSALFGVGYVIVRYRKNGVLKRLNATPLTALEFLSAQVCSRMILILVVSVIVYIGVNYFIHFSMNGSYFSLLIIFTLGAFSLVSMSLIVAARLASEELAGGLLNMITWPMMFLSGVWFSIEGIHPYLQKLAVIFPLTHLISGARAIMIDGAGLADISGQLLVLTLMGLFFLIIGALYFRWE